MTSRVRRWFGLAVMAALCGPPGLDAQKSAPAVPDVLKAAAAYVVQYSQKLQAVGADEDYMQMDTSGGQMNHIRRLNGDVAMVGFGDGHVAMFRDTYAIDTKLLHERIPRLLKLFENPPMQQGGTMQYAKAFTEDSVRQYISGDLHALDSPLDPLEVLRAENQARLTFKFDSAKMTDGVQIVVLRFTELAAPSLLKNPLNLPVTGRVWIEAASGAVRETEVTASNKFSMVRSTVTYLFDKALNLWLPQELSQRFDLSTMGPGGDSAPRIHEGYDTHAKYTKFRQVPVDLDKIR